jgi:hypothetical protein
MPFKKAGNSSEEASVFFSGLLTPTLEVELGLPWIFFSHSSETSNRNNTTGVILSPTEGADCTQSCDSYLYYDV